MDSKKLEAAVFEAKRFIERAESLPPPELREYHGHITYNNYFPRESGAIKRASMDLTRALADLRRR